MARSVLPYNENMCQTMRMFCCPFLLLYGKTRIYACARTIQIKKHVFEVQLMLGFLSIHPAECCGTKDMTAAESTYHENGRASFQDPFLCKTQRTIPG